MVRTPFTWMMLVSLLWAGASPVAAESGTQSDRPTKSAPVAAEESGSGADVSAVLLPSSSERLDEQIRVSRLGPTLPGSEPAKDSGATNQALTAIPGGLNLWALGFGGLLLVAASWVGSRRLTRRPTLEEEARGTHLVERDFASGLSSRLETVEQSVLDLVESFDSIARRLRRMELRDENEVAMPAGAWAKEPVRSPSPTAEPVPSPEADITLAMERIPTTVDPNTSDSALFAVASEPSDPPLLEVAPAPSDRTLLQRAPDPEEEAMAEPTLYEEPDPLFGGVEAAALGALSSSLAAEAEEVSAELPDLVEVSPWEHFVADTTSPKDIEVPTPATPTPATPTPATLNPVAPPTVAPPAGLPTTATRPVAPVEPPPSRAPEVAKKWVRSRSVGQATTSTGLSPAELSNLTRMREQVLDLAAAGVGVKEIGPRVGLGQAEVELILKSLFRPKSDRVPTAESGQVGR